MAQPTEVTLSIGELARRARVAVPTIRAWEQRYGLLTPTRSAGGHRRYSLDDVRRLRVVQALVDEGVTLAAAAEQAMAPAVAPEAGTARRRTMPVPSVDGAALRAAYGATRALLHIRRPGEAVEILVGLVEQLGGAVAPADKARPDALPLDLSLGLRPPMLPTADPYSVARLHLERVLPGVVEDARRAATLAERRHSSSGEPLGR